MRRLLLILSILRLSVSLAGDVARENREQFVNFVDSMNLSVLEGRTEEGRACRINFSGFYADVEVEGQEIDSYFTSTRTQYCETDVELRSDEFFAVGYEPDDNAFSALILKRDEYGVSAFEFYNFEHKFGISSSHMRKRSCRDLSKRVEKRQPSIKCFIER